MYAEKVKRRKEIRIADKAARSVKTRKKACGRIILIVVRCHQTLQREFICHLQGTKEGYYIYMKHSVEKLGGEHES